MKNRINFLFKSAQQFSFLQLRFSSSSIFKSTPLVDNSYAPVCQLFVLFLFLYLYFFYSILYFNRSKLSKRLIYIEVMEPLLKYVGLCVWF